VCASANGLQASTKGPVCVCVFVCVRVCVCVCVRRANQTEELSRCGQVCDDGCVTSQCMSTIRLVQRVCDAVCCYRRL
jgi:hypothetical protein